MRTSSWTVSAPSSLCPPRLVPTPPRSLQIAPGVALSSRCYSKLNGYFPGYATWLFQTELSQELQTAGSTQNQPVAPQHQQRRPFLSRSAQPAIHTRRPRTPSLASRVPLQPYQLQDTDGVFLSARFQNSNWNIVFTLTLSFLLSGCIKDKQHFRSPGGEETSAPDLPLR